MTKLSQAIALATAMTAGLVATTTTQAADVEVSASVSIANMYLWRGQDLGAVTDNGGTSTGGVPAISGDISVGLSGAYAGVWTSSGDANAGQEYDLYLGYGGEAGDFSYDLSIWSYNYSDGGLTEDPFTRNSEVILGLGYMGAEAGIYKQVGDDVDNDNMYYTLGYGLSSFSGVVGYTDVGARGADYTHIDLSYAYNDNLSFTVSKIVDQETNELLDQDAKFLVSYSLPIEL